ncbi:MAG: phage head-tail joining protein [Thiobacillaceae bacterium]
MPWTQQHLDATAAAIASGELTVRYGDRAVTYRSMAELLQAYAVIKEALAAEAGTMSDRFSFAQTSKG